MKKILISLLALVGGTAWAATPIGTIQNRDSLQAGATAYPSYVYAGSSVTSYGPMRSLGAFNVGNNATGASELSRLEFNPSNASPTLNLYTNGTGTSATINFIAGGGNTAATIGVNPTGGALGVTSARGFAVSYGTALSSVNVSGLSTFAGPVSATGGITVSTVGVTGFANFTGSASSTFTYGLNVGSMDVVGAGNGFIELTVGGSTYSVTATSTTNTQWHMAGWGSSNNQLIDMGAPIAPGGFGTINAGTAGLMSYYNIAGSTLSQIPGTLVTATSVTLPQTAITSTFTVLVGGGLSTNTPGSVDIWVKGDTIGVTRPFTVGTEQHNDQIYLLDKTWFYSEYGVRTNSLNVGNATGGNTKIASIQSASQYIDYYNSGQMEFQTSTFPTPDMLFRPSTQQVLRLSTTSVAINGTANSVYTLRIASGTAGVLPYQIAFTTMGVITVSSQAASTPVLTSCGTGPIAIGNSHAFQITGGSASTGCIATFPAGTYRNAPSCSVSQEAMSVVNALTYSTTNTALTISQTGLGTAKLDIICYGLNE